MPRARRRLRLRLRLRRLGEENDDGEGGGDGDGGLRSSSARVGLPVVPDLRARDAEAPRLVDLMRMSYEEWDAWSRGRAVRRAGYALLRRNVVVALGNWLASVHELPENAVAVLREALSDESELVREHAAWALRQVGASASG